MGILIQEQAPVKIYLSDINHKDLTFLFRYKLDIGDLAASIKQIGLINPLVLRQRKSLQIVSGFRRVFALKRLRKKSMQAFILSSETEDVDCILLTLNDNHFVNSLNDLDKAKTLKKLSAYFLIGEEVLLNRITPLLGLPKSKEVIDGYLKIAELEDRIKEGFLYAKVNFGQLLILARLTSDERLSIYNKVLLNCRPNLNEFKEITENLRFIRQRYGKTYKEIFNKKIIKKNLFSKELTSRQKTTSLLNILRSLRYPLLTVKSRKFLKIIESMNTDDKLRITAPENFEGNFINILLKPTSYYELNNLMNMLKRKEAIFTDLFKLLN